MFIRGFCVSVALLSSSISAVGFAQSAPAQPWVAPAQAPPPSGAEKWRLEPFEVQQLNTKAVSAQRLLSRVRLAKGAAPDTSGDDTQLQAARERFRKGMKLYSDGNFSGALVEFQASYRLKPAASTLQNVALSFKALFRYVEASQSLGRLLEVHAAELSAEQLAAVKKAQGELEGFIGHIQLDVSPRAAKVTLNGRALEAAQLGEPLRLDVGEYKIRAEYDGYAPVERTIRVASGADAVVVQIRLRAVKGFLEIEASDPEAAIALDGAPLARFRWRGAVEPGRHYIQVYKEGVEPFEQVVEVEVGETYRINASLSEGGGAPSIQLENSKRAPRALQEQRGFYGLLGLNALSLNANPSALAEESQSSEGGSLGLMFGYRVWSPFGVELLVELGGNSGQACERGADCKSAPEGLRDYSLNSLRIGPSLRLFSGGRSLRFSGALGFGAVAQRYELASTESRLGAEAEGVDPYFSVELGGQYNWNRWILGLALLVHFNGTTSLASGLDDSSKQPIYEEDGVVTAGLGLRFGWGVWEP